MVLIQLVIVTVMEAVPATVAVPVKAAVVVVEHQV
jgi:hypothetical protein